MIFDAYIISIDWGVEELFVLAKEKWRFHKENGNINELDVSQQKWIVVLALSYSPLGFY